MQTQTHIVQSRLPPYRCGDCPPVAWHAEKDPAGECVDFASEVTDARAGCRREGMWASGVNVSPSFFQWRRC